LAWSPGHLFYGRVRDYLKRGSFSHNLNSLKILSEKLFLSNFLFLKGFFTLLPDGTKFNFIQQIIPLSPGFIKFPQPQIKLIENNSKNYDLDVVNRQISIYMGSCLPKEIFVLVRMFFKF